MARRFFVNPYDPAEIYLLDVDSVHYSNDGGRSWHADKPLHDMLTDNGQYQTSCNDTWCVMNDIIFDRNTQMRFALGIAGVFYSQDGKSWPRLIDPKAMPCKPRGAWFDPLTDPNDPSLYVALDGRGILRCHPIPYKP